MGCPTLQFLQFFEDFSKWLEDVGYLNQWHIKNEEFTMAYRNGIKCKIEIELNLLSVCHEVNNLRVNGRVPERPTNDQNKS